MEVSDRLIVCQPSEQTAFHQGKIAGVVEAAGASRSSVPGVPSLTGARQDVQPALGPQRQQL